MAIPNPAVKTVTQKYVVSIPAFAPPSAAQAKVVEPTAANTPVTTPVNLDRMYAPPS
jgi:hypothetical protein